jgi:hypothetical protein
MGRKICIVLLRIVSVFFILSGISIFILAYVLLEPHDSPVSFYILYFSYGSACILLGIISWKHVDSFGSTLGAFLLMLARLVTFSLACIFFIAVAPQVDESSAPGVSEMGVTVEIIEWVLALAFLGATFLLTIINKEKSGKRVTIQSSGRYVIDPRNYRTDSLYVGCLVVFWLIWAPATAIVTYMAYTERHPFLFVWLIFGYLGTIGIPVAIFFKNRKQVIEASGDSLFVYGTMGYPWSKARIYKHDLQALTLEHYKDDDPESVYTLNLLQKSGVRTRRIMLAAFVHPEDKAILFEEIREFLQKNGFKFQIKNKMTDQVET